MPAPSARLLLEMGRRGAGALTLPKAAPTKAPDPSALLTPKPATPTPSPTQPIAARPTAPAPAAAPSTALTPYDDLIATEAWRRGIDPELAKAVAYFESRGNPQARGAAGEVGLFQVIPRDMAGRFAWAASRPSAAEMSTPEAQVSAGLDILQSALQSAGGDTANALSIYNSGRPLAQAPDSTKQVYVPGVMGIYRSSRQAQPAAARAPEGAFTPPSPHVPETTFVAPPPHVPETTRPYEPTGPVGAYRYLTMEDIRGFPAPPEVGTTSTGAPDLPRLFGLTTAAEQAPAVTTTGAPDLARVLGIAPTEAPAAVKGAAQAPAVTQAVPEKVAKAPAVVLPTKAPAAPAVSEALPGYQKQALTAMPSENLAAVVARKTSQEPELLDSAARTLRGGMIGAATVGIPLMAVSKGGRGGILGGVIGGLAALLAPEKAEPVISWLGTALQAGSNIARQVLMTPALLTASEEEKREIAAPPERTPVPSSLGEYWKQLKAAIGPVEVGIPTEEIVERVERMATSTPQEREAAWEAGRAGYTPGRAQQAYLRIMEGDNPDAVVQELYRPDAMEIALETVYDPLNVVADVLSTVARGRKWTQVIARFTTPDKRTIEQLAADYARPLTRAQYLSPWTHRPEARQSRLLEESATVINQILADAPDDVERLVRLRRFVSDPDKFATFYQQPVAQTEPGKAAVLLIRKLAGERGAGGVEDLQRVFATAAKEAKDAGLVGTPYYDRIAQAMYERLSRSLDNVIPTQRTIWGKAAQPLARAMQPINRLFSVLYLNRPAFGVRNAGNNFMTTLVDGVLPFDSEADIAGFERAFGPLATAAKRGVTMVGEPRPRNLWNYFISKSQDVEVAFSRRAVYRGTKSFMDTMWPRRVRDLVDEIAPSLSPEAARTLRYRMGAALNEEQLVEAIASVLGPSARLRRGVPKPGGAAATAAPGPTAPHPPAPGAAGAAAPGPTAPQPPTPGPAGVAAAAPVPPSAAATAAAAAPTLGPSIDPDLIAHLDRISPGTGTKVRQILEEATDNEDFARRLTQEIEPELERVRTAAEAPDGPTHPESPTGELKTAAREAGWSDAEVSSFFESEQYRLYSRRYYDAIQRVQDAADKVASLQPDLTTTAYALEGRFKGQVGLVRDRHFSPASADQFLTWPEVTDDVTSLANEYIDQLAKIAGTTPEALRSATVPPPRTGPLPGRAAQEAAARAERWEAAAREEFARAAQEAGFTAKESGAFDIGNEVHLANALRQAGIPIEGKTLTFSKLTPEQRLTAINILRQRQAVHGVPVPQAAQADATARIVEHFPLDELNVAPERFQYRIATGPAGVTSKFAETTRWSEEAAGTVLAWREPSTGKVWVLDGHHRVDLAKRLGRKDIPVMLSNAPTEELARAEAALANIAAGHGTAIDAAKFLRSTGMSIDDLRQWGVSLREPVAREGLALANLHPSVYSAVVQGDMPLQRGVIIGEMLPNHDDQLALIQALSKQKRTITNDVLRELIDQVRQAPVGRERQTTLWGPEEWARSYVVERADLQSHIRHELTRDRRLFSSVADEADRLARAGNVIDIESSEGVSREAAQLLDIFDAVKNQVGPISDIVNDGARRLAEGANPAQVRKEVYDAVRNALPDVIRGTEALPTPGAGQIPLGGVAQPGLFGPTELGGRVQYYRKPSPPEQYPGPWEVGEHGPEWIPPGRQAAPRAGDVLEKAGTPRPQAGADQAAVADEIEELLGRISADADFSRAPAPGPIPDQEQWIEKALSDLNGLKSAASFAGAEARDFALLDYSDRRDIDTLMNLFFIFPYWGSRTYPNWMVRFSTKPNVVAAYLRYQNMVRQHVKDAGLPDYLGDYLEFDVPGLPGPIYTNVRYLLDPLYDLSTSYDDPVILSTALGRFRESVAGSVGLSMHPAFTFLDAGLRLATGKEEEVPRVLGHLSSHTRVIRYLTGKLGFNKSVGVTLEPWLWRGSPFIGGDEYAMLRATRQLAAMQLEGEITPTEASEAARAYSTGNFDHPLVQQALHREIEDRFLPTMSSFVLGLPARTRSPSEVEIDEFMTARAAIWAVRDEVTDEEWSGLWDELYRQYPFGETISLARKDRMEADTAWVYNVMNRLPPGQRTTAYLETGVSKDILDKFWGAQTGEGALPRLEQLSEADRMRLLAASVELAERYDVPTPVMSAEWEEVSRKSRQMYEDIETNFPGVMALEDEYYRIKEGNEAYAWQFLQQHPELEQMWDYRTAYRYRDPQLMWYYGPAARDQAIDYIWDVYFSLEEGKPRQRLVETMGEDFDNLFMAKKYDYISDAELFSWTTFLGGYTYYTQKDMPDDWQGTAPSAEDMLVRLR